MIKEPETRLKDVDPADWLEAKVELHRLRTRHLELVEMTDDAIRQLTFRFIIATAVLGLVALLAGVWIGYEFAVVDAAGVAK